MKKGSINKIETFGLVDGPGIRTVVFLSGCKLRCKYCHNPEMWHLQELNYTPEELAERIIRNKPYFKRNNGGVTFSGGEPLLQGDFLIEVCKLLKKENIHITIDTSGVGNGNYEEILSYIDLVLLDIKQTTPKAYKELTGVDIDESEKFIQTLNQSNKPVWIRQVIVPGMMDNEQYLKELNEQLKKINNIEKIEFLPYHTLGKEKYHELGMKYPFEHLESMDNEKCKQLYNKFIQEYYKK
jgi:pyruvate formate lyase activating enzyme